MLAPGVLLVAMYYILFFFLARFELFVAILIEAEAMVRLFAQPQHVTGAPVTYRETSGKEIGELRSET